MSLNVPEGGGGIGYTLAFLAMVFGPPILAIALVIGVIWFVARAMKKRRGQWPPPE